MTDKEFHKIVNDLSDAMFRFAFYKTGNEETAKDVVQESFINLWKEQKKLDYYLNIQSYCFTLIKNKCIDHHRSNNKRMSIVKTLENRPTIESPIEKNLEREDRLKQMFVYLRKLDNRQSLVLRLRDFEGYSYSEIADLSKMSLSNVKVTLFRARKALQLILKEENEIRNVTY